MINKKKAKRTKKCEIKKTKLKFQDYKKLFRSSSDRKKNKLFKKKEN